MRRIPPFVFLAAVITLLLPTATFALTGRVTNFLGKLYGGDGLTATQAYLDNPGGFTADGSGNFFIADTFNNVVRRIDAATDIITTFAGSGQMGSADGLAGKASFRQPEDIAVAADGTIYVADTLNGRIRRISNGRVTTWPQKFAKPTGLYLTEKYLYVTDEGGGRVWRITISSRLARLVARVDRPKKITGVGDTRLYVISHGQARVTQIDLNASGVQSGTQKTVKRGLSDALGIGMYGNVLYFTVGANGIYNEIWRLNTAERGQVATQIVNRLETEWYNYASDVLFKGDVMYLLFSKGSSLYRLDADGQSEVRVAGKHRSGAEFGAKADVLLGKPKALAVTADQKTVYLSQNHQFAAYDTTTNTLRFLAGHFNDNYVEGTGDTARTSQPLALVLSKNEKTLYFVDRNNNRVRALDIGTGTTSYLTGAGKINLAAGNTNAYREGAPCVGELRTTIAGCAYFDKPSGLALSKDGTSLYVADTGNNRIRAVTIATGATRRIAGSGKAGFRNARGSAAQFSSPYGLVLSADGKILYVVDRGNHAIRAITLATGNVTTVAGTGKPGGKNGRASQAQFHLPEYITRAGNRLYVSEVGANRLRIVDLRTKTVSLLAGSGKPGNTRGIGRQASFFNPKGLAIWNGKLLVADSTNDVLRQVETQ